MKSGTPSRTSDRTTAVRASEMRRPASERICNDPYAVHFLSPFYKKLGKYPFLGRAYGWFKARICPGLRGGILARTRYIDERLTVSLAEGIEQLVILGAGNDSRAYRLFDPDRKVAVFEVDHPATQQAKVAKVRELFGEVPGHVTFVPVDFGRDDLNRQLCAAGYDRNKKTLFIWEGVIYYLSAAAVDALLVFVTENSGCGSSIVFDYFPRSVVNGTCNSKEGRNLRRIVARMGEPLVFGINDEEIEQFLQLRGFKDVEVVGSDACKEAWFHGANKSMKVSEIFRFVHARHFCVTGGNHAERGW